MAGSRKWFQYFDDAGAAYAINLDESNTRAINGTTGDYPSTGGSIDSVPRNIKVREIFYSNTARTRTIRCVPLTQAKYNEIITAVTGAAIIIGDPITGTGNLAIARANGERRRIPTPLDTGLDDGTQP